MCEEHGNDPHHTVSRFILDQTPLKLIVHDPATNRFETVTELSILDRIKVSTHVGYNVFRHIKCVLARPHQQPECERGAPHALRD